MRGRSSKQDSKKGMELDRLNSNKLKEEPPPHLSGAYIRSLVKQLTSSRTKEETIMNHPHPKDHRFVNEEGSSVQDMTKNQQPQQHKKQVRRRLHTSRPYQERLLNMAEARREIVAALKFHRATMKEQQKQQNNESPHPQPPSLPIHLSSPSSCFEQEGKIIKSRRNPRIYPSNSSNFSNYLDTLSYTSLSPHEPPPPTSPPPYPYYWPNPPILPPENPNFPPLPNQTLGLNLNFQDFNNLYTSLYHNPSSSSPSQSPSSFSSSSPSSLHIPTEEVAKFQEAGIGIGVPCMVSDLGETYGGGGLHQVMDDDELAEIRSIGEQHQMEWSDTMNLVQSAWWLKFLKTMESDPPQLKPEDDPFEQVMEFPPWLNANEQHLDDYSSQDYYHDPSLPCMDIGEIEGMDGEWLA